MGKTVALYCKHPAHFISIHIPYHIVCIHFSLSETLHVYSDIIIVLLVT